jgi:hypothetical protein
LRNFPFTSSQHDFHITNSDQFRFTGQPDSGLVRQTGMRNVTFVTVVLLVAGISYDLGRRHGVGGGAQAIPEQSNSLPLLHDAEAPIQKKADRDPSGTIRAVERIDLAAPYAQNMTAAQRGYEAARADLDAALKQIDSLPVTERMGFITGIFSFVAKNRTPAEGLKVYQQVPEAHRPNALRALVSEWIYSRSPLDENMRHLKREGTLTISGSRAGLEVELSSMLASSQPDAELTAAWLNNFSRHSARSEIFSRLSGRVAFLDPDSMLTRTEGWTAWEKEHAARSFLSNWSYGAPQEAWNWYQSHRERFDRDFSSNILAPWAASDSEGARKLLNRLQDPAQRQAAISAIGKVLGERNTDAAVAWAEGMADAKEREAAHRAVYEGAPRGIGAVLDFENGFAKLRGIVPGSPLEGTGARAGDRILEVRESDGTNHPLYGTDPQTTVSRIRGEPGTQMTLRVLRQDEATGQPKEHLIPVTRGQLYLNEKLIPKPPS